MAIVIRSSTATHQYVVVGRSLFETERRITLFGFLAQLAMIVGWMATLAVAAILTKLDTKHSV